MKMVKNIAVVAFAASFMFANIGFHKSNVYEDMNSATGTTTSYGATFDLNGTTSIGYDSDLGMIMAFEVPAGVSLRLGWNGTDDNSAVGLGYTWWTGGSGFNTSINNFFSFSSFVWSGFFKGMISDDAMWNDTIER